jgi:transposase
MAKTIDMAGVEKCVIMADKGFVSADNVNKLKKNRLRYIVPLKRSSSLILEPHHFMGVFMYDCKPVKY